ncbi:MAG TPA: hypothetical protein VMY87_03190 [Armatimonadota bacterium]|nr:hypothetical protein [Armatimonadota bacterium]
MCIKPNGVSQSLLLMAAGSATVAFGVALAAGWEPGLRGEWVWRENVLPVRMWSALAAGIALAVVSGVLCRGRAWETMRPLGRALSLVLLILIVFAFQVAMLNAVGVPWVTPGAYIVSPNATTYFGVALDVRDPADWIARYPELLATLPYHAATHPPGFVLFFLAIQRASAALIGQPSPQLAELATGYSDLFGLGLAPPDAAAAVASALAIALVGALGLLPLYFLARRLSDPGVAICSTCLAAGMPGLLLLASSPDLIVMALTVLALCLGYCAWRGKSALLELLAGLTVAAGVFFSLGFALVGAWAALWIVFGALGSGDRRPAVRRALAAGAVGLVGFAAFYLALYLLYGYHPVAVAVKALSAHRGVTAVEGARTYWKWVLMNPVECALFAGLPLMVAALWSWRALGDAQHCRLRAFLISWLVLFALLDVSGAVRGEVGRIWLFLLWPAALAAGAGLASGPERRGSAVALLILLQVVQVVLMKGYLTMYSIL